MILPSFPGTPHLHLVVPLGTSPNCAAAIPFLPPPSLSQGAPLWQLADLAGVLVVGHKAALGGIALGAAVVGGLVIKVLPAHQHSKTHAKRVSALEDARASVMLQGMCARERIHVLVAKLTRCAHMCNVTEPPSPPLPSRLYNLALPGLRATNQRHWLFPFPARVVPLTPRSRPSLNSHDESPHSSAGQGSKGQSVGAARGIACFQGFRCSWLMAHAGLDSMPTGADAAG